MRGVYRHPATMVKVSQVVELWALVQSGFFKPYCAAGKQIQCVIIGFW